MRNLPAFVWLDKHFADQVITRCDDLIAMSYFAESGQGLAFLPDDQLRPEITRLFGVQENKPSNLWLLTHPDLRNVERIKLVMQHLTKAFSQEWSSWTTRVWPGKNITRCCYGKFTRCRSLIFAKRGVSFLGEPMDYYDLFIQELVKYSPKFIGSALLLGLGWVIGKRITHYWNYRKS